MIAAIEDAILARLRAGESRLGYPWRTAATYPADWDIWLEETKGQIRTPAVWTGFAGTRAIRAQSDGELWVDGVFGLTVMDRHAGEEKAQRRGGSGGAIGTYQLLEDALGLLAGFCPPDAFKPIEVGRVRHVGRLGAERRASMIAAELLISFPIPRLPQNLTEEEPALFEAFHANWDIPAFGGVDAAPGTPGIQIPADARADATDHVELPQ